MEYTRLGRSGLQVSRLCLGTMNFGPVTEEEQAHRILDAALEAGVNYVDTADVYGWAENKGWTEEIIGRWFAGSAQRRRRTVLATKVFGRWSDWPGDGGLSARHIVSACEDSLRRLQTDHIDVYQAHRYDYFTPLEETMQAFADLVRMGKVLYLGVSEWTADQMRDGHALAQDLGIQLISNQPQYSMLWRVIEAEVVPTCAELGISQVVWSPIAQGVLTGKYRPGEQPPEGSRATDEKGGADMIARWMSDDVLTRVQELRPLAEEVGLSMAALAVAWVLQNDNVATAIIGASRPEQVNDNASAAGVRLPDDLLKRIDKILDPVIERDPAKTLESSPKEREA
jgi:aryl-alcohol dehydrogenase-like predicted oxidoreductase